jgi:hypothetical protein
MFFFLIVVREDFCELQNTFRRPGGAETNNLRKFSICINTNVNNYFIAWVKRHKTFNWIAPERSEGLKKW